MPYDRIYTLSEVSRILYESELRPSPKSGKPGHALGLHADLRDDVLDKRYKTVILLGSTVEETRSIKPGAGLGTPIPPHKVEPIDGKFLNRKDAIKAIGEALNSAGGQQELRKLNGADKSVTISVRIVENRGKIHAAVCQHPTINVGTKKKKTLIFVPGPNFYKEGIAEGIVVIVDKLPEPNPGCDIHIQTAYPKEVV